MVAWVYLTYKRLDVISSRIPDGGTRSHFFSAATGFIDAVCVCIRAPIGRPGKF